MDSENRTETSKMKYPVLMVHGMGFRDFNPVNYWGRIPKKIKGEGCEVYYGLQDSNGSVESNGTFLAERIEKLCRENGIEKFNVIAHSKGGQDIRYAISTLNMGHRIASLTTINTPHNGSKTVQLLLSLVPAWPVKVGCKVCDLWFRIIGDKHPDTYQCIKLFEIRGAEAFNAENPDRQGIYYQSYAFTCKNFLGDIFMWFPNLFVRLIEGENDGLLTPRAVKWTNFRGHFHSTTNRGISHCDQVDMRRMRFTRKPPKNEFEISDITDFYRGVVRELKEKGF